MSAQHELFGDDGPPVPEAAETNGADAGDDRQQVAAQASEERPVLGDADARRMATTCFDRPLMLEAGAGTGKTATLVARVVHWCLSEGWEDHAAGELEPEEAAPLVLRRITAITFTEAAAAEMSRRVSFTLAELQQAAVEDGPLSQDALPIGLLVDALPADPAVVRLRAGALRGALDQLNISTIHAFCRRLVAAHPLEAGLDPGFEIDASYAATELAVRAVLEEFLRTAWGSGSDPRLAALAARRIDPTKIEEAVLALVKAGARASDLEQDPLREEVIGPRVAELGAAVDAFFAVDLARMAELNARATSHAVLEAVGETKLALDADAGIEALCARLEDAWIDKAQKRLKVWAKGDLNKTELGALDEAGQVALPEAAGRLHAALEPLRALDPELLGIARPLLHGLLASVGQELRRRGIATFSDLLVEARNLLEQHPAVARAERARLSQLLIDEFQDTDGVQCAVVRQLALADDPDASGGAAGRPGLFLVGDPKQSIFAWRSADLEAYDSFRDEVTAAGGSCLTLSCNFRSRAGILAEVERCLAPVMEELRGVQPPFRPLEPARKNAGASDDASSIECWVSWPPDRNGGGDIAIEGWTTDETYKAEARAVARDVRRTHDDQGVAWSKIALLFRSLSGAQPYLDRMRELGVPYQVQSDKRYYKRREVVDATALVRAILDPTDLLALTSLLRSPMVGVPDAALGPLWSEQLPGRMSELTDPDPAAFAELEASVRRAVAKVPSSVPGLAGIAGWEEGLVFALQSLVRLRAEYRELPADTWIERVRSLFLPDVIEAARFLGGWRVANLDRFFRDLEATLEERAGDYHSVLRTLRANLERDDRAEGARVADSGVDAVQVLTIHGSKGLEFEHVYVTQTHKGSNHRTDSLPTEFTRHIGGASYRLFGSPEPGWHDDTLRREQAEAAERVRLLYVALTRAEDRLVVLGSHKLAPKLAAWREVDSFNGLLEHRAGSALAVGALAEALAAGEAPEVQDLHGVRWRVPAAERDEAPAPEVTAAPERALPSADSIRRVSEALSAARGVAAERMARPFHLAASGLGGDAARASDAVLPARSGGVVQRAAMLVGTALHRVFELAELGADPTAELERLREEALAWLRASLAEDERASGLERAEHLLDEVATHGLFAKLVGLGDGVLARELPVLLPPLPDTSAVGFVSGTIDLLYRDGDEVVVCDYKTDREASPERSAAYRAQGAAYVRAVRDALGLERAPRFELWYLDGGRVEAHSDLA